LPSLSKILEKTLEIQISQFLDLHNILPEKQSGFRSGYGCSTALTDVTDNIFKELDSHKATVLLMLDYTKAFDMLNHEILISILKFIGFSVSAANLIKSFLAGRTQRVCLNGVFSDVGDVTVGVPQGSILGPLLYSIYTSNFFRCLRHCDYHMYADDTQLLFSFNPANSDQANECINEDLETLLNVSKSHMLKLNPDKSVAILFAGDNMRNNLLQNLNLKIGDNNVVFRDSAKNLGVIIDYKLRFREHVTAKLKIAYSVLKMLYSHRHYLERDTKKMLCDALILSHLNFCDNIYGPCLDSGDIRRIQKLQNSCLRFIYGIRRRERISHKLKDAGWLNMQNRRLLHTLCFFYKVLKYKSPPYLIKKIRYRTDIHNINIRNRYLLNIPSHQKELYKRSFSYCIASLVNKYKIYDLTFSLNTFKKRMGGELLSQN
jgi:hypothetical protein